MKLSVSKLRRKTKTSATRKVGIILEETETGNWIHKRKSLRKNLGVEHKAVGLEMKKAC